MTRLWEADHPYYCNETNFCHFKSWQDFLAEEGDSDMDFNLVFRWDWDGKTDDNDNPVTVPDDNYRAYTLKIFFMGQRKGLCRSVSIEVCRTDEPAVRRWLQSRFDYLLKLWEPLRQGASDAQN